MWLFLWLDRVGVADNVGSHNFLDSEEHHDDDIKGLAIFALSVWKTTGFFFDNRANKCKLRGKLVLDIVNGADNDNDIDNNYDNGNDDDNDNDNDNDNDDCNIYPDFLLLGVVSLLGRASGGLVLSSLRASTFVRIICWFQVRW